MTAVLASLGILLCVVVAVVVIVRRGLRRGAIRRVHYGPRFAVGRKARDAARED